MRFSSVLLLAAAILCAYAQDPTIVAPGGSDTLAPTPSGTTVVGGGATDTAPPPDASGPAASTPTMGGEAPLPPVSGSPDTDTPVGSGIPLPPAGSLDTTPVDSTPTDLPGDGAALALGASPAMLSLLVAGLVGAML